jgi:hypothetical protein
MMMAYRFVYNIVEGESQPPARAVHAATATRPSMTRRTAGSLTDQSPCLAHCNCNSQLPIHHNKPKESNSAPFPTAEDAVLGSECTVKSLRWLAKEIWAKGTCGMLAGWLLGTMGNAREADAWPAGIEVSECETRGC